MVPKAVRYFPLYVFVWLVAWTFIGTTVYSADADGARTSAVAKFLKDNVLYKPLVRKDASRIDNDKVEAVFARKLTFTNLVEGEDHLEFYAFGEIQQTNYDLDASGNHVGEGKNQDRTMLVHFTLGKMKSTGELIGHLRSIAATSRDGTALGGAVAVRSNLNGGKLVLLLSNPLYSDAFAAKGNYKPGASDSTWELSQENGKLVLKESSTSFDVDPKTLKREKAGSTETFVSREK